MQPKTKKNLQVFGYACSTGEIMASNREDAFHSPKYTIRIDHLVGIQGSRRAPDRLSQVRGDCLGHARQESTGLSSADPPSEPICHLAGVTYFVHQVISIS